PHRLLLASTERAGDLRDWDALEREVIDLDVSADHLGEALHRLPRPQLDEVRPRPELCVAHEAILSNMVSPATVVWSFCRDALMTVGTSTMRTTWPSPRTLAPEMPRERPRNV